jgi:hypothetical protein
MVCLRLGLEAGWERKVKDRAADWVTAQTSAHAQRQYPTPSDHHRAAESWPLWPFVTWAAHLHFSRAFAFLCPFARLSLHIVPLVPGSTITPNWDCQLTQTIRCDGLTSLASHFDCNTMARSTFALLRAAAVVALASQAVAQTCCEFM